MFKAFVLICVLGLTSAAQAASGPLDGKSYCRTVKTGGLFGQPVGERENCLSFARGTVTDNSNTFFGKPPESAIYAVKGNKVTFGTSEYEISSDESQLTTVKGSTIAGVVFTLKP